MMAAVLLRVPTLAYEPNVVPGLANRIVGRAVSAAAVNFERSRRYFRNAMVTGVPVRKEFFEVPPLNEEAPGLLVTGGSQGARVFNEVLPRIARALFQQVPGLTLVHQTGARRGGEVRGRYMDEDIDPLRWKAEEFLGDMPRRMSAASLVLCRSGATTVAELAAAGRPALLIPFPKSADDHQRKNAEAFANAGAGRVLLESELTPDRLLKELVGMLGNRELLSGMGTRARTLGRPDALERIGTMVAQLAGR
jgi:UDP-N-acetylglucosamine--N-acetylmuramyl-(pentapeptide) pyrophosphoryl-undecaprenol N-acetylglucosamine transferase